MAWQAHSPSSTVKQDLKLAREELEARGALLKDSAEGLEDLGPTLDCVVWHDGQHYRTALDTSDMYPEDPSQGRCSSPKCHEIACACRQPVLPDTELDAAGSDGGSIQVRGPTQQLTPACPALRGMAVRVPAMLVQVYG